MLEVNSLDHNGRGISKLDNKIIFIENALPGEIVEVCIKNEKKNYIEATVSSYIKKSKDRIESPCPHYDKCGGCDLLHLSYENQLKFKQDKVNNIIKKYLNKDIKVNNIIKCDNNFNYRNKTTFQVKDNIGFFKKNTHDIIKIDKCLIGNERINDAIKYLNELDIKCINQIICRTSLDKLMIVIDTDNLNLNIECLKGIADSIYIKNNGNFTLVYGDESIYEVLGEYKYLISPDSFFQVNINTCMKLYSKIKDYVGVNKKVLDLYCGTGAIGIFINDNNEVLGVELNKFAIEDANRNKELNNLKNVDFICGDSAIDIKDFNPNIVIVDPPRSGLSKKTIDNIIKMYPNKIIYVSCDPMTLVRDLNVLSEKYNIDEVTPFDMFPNTMHVECLTILSCKDVIK